VKYSGTAGDFLWYVIPTMVPLASVGLTMDRFTTRGTNSIEYAPQVNLVSHIVIPMILATVCIASLIEKARWEMESQGTGSRAMLGRTIRIAPVWCLTTGYVILLDPVGQIAAGRNASFGLFCATFIWVLFHSSMSSAIPLGVLVLGFVERSAEMYAPNILFWPPSDTRDYLLISIATSATIGFIALDSFGLVHPVARRS